MQEMVCCGAATPSLINPALVFSHQETPEEPGGDSGGVSSPVGRQAGAEHPCLTCHHPSRVQPAVLHGLRHGPAVPAAPSPVRRAAAQGDEPLLWEGALRGQSPHLMHWSTKPTPLSSLPMLSMLEKCPLSYTLNSYQSNTVGLIVVLGFD